LLGRCRSCCGRTRGNSRGLHVERSLGLVVSELLTNVARHALFDDRNPEAKVKLLLAGNVAKCAVSDNGSASDLIVRGRGLTIVSELAGGLGGRVHAICAADGSSFLLTFPLIESEQRAARSAHVVLKRRKVCRSRRLQVPRAEDAAAG
jgi:glucose-6-phosphate-specific signal transduction histidine kinase